MKPPLVDSLAELSLPLFQIGGRIGVEFGWFEVVCFEPEPDGLPQNLLPVFFGLDNGGLADDLEGDVEGELHGLQDRLGAADVAHDQ